ncbi:MAG: DHH family phosphoesterase [bacterium]|nr:DHH family phosphoesterase [bacterium]
MAEIKNLKKLANRISKAIAEKERIILYGDSDMDGACSVIILKEAICSLGGDSPIIYFSDRKREEHGINKKALDFLKGKAPALFLSLDCGIANFREVELAKKLGFEVAIADHHNIQGRIPKVRIVVNPKQGSKNSPFYHLAAAGIVFKLAEAILGRKLSKTLKEDMLALAALATLAELVQETGENQKILEQGLPLLESSWRPAVRLFFSSSLTKNCISTREIVWKVISIINITSKEGVFSETYLFLNSQTPEEARLRFEEFLRKGVERQAKIGELTEELKKKVSFMEKDSAVIFEDLNDRQFPILSAVASRICDFFKKPTFIFTKEKGENWGGFRMPFEEDGVGALASCRQLLRRYGGHPAAGGFYFENKNKEKLKECLAKHFNKNLHKSV